MRALQLFATRKDYEAYVLDELIAVPLFRDHGFYLRLVRFVLDAKAPLFYFQSDPAEHANFSAYYNFVLVRETYTNPVLRAMYFLHDFAHLLFYYPHDVASVTPAEFDEAVIAGEYAASNETEVLLHYRVPEARERVFHDRRILFDLLRERGVRQPPPRALLALRRLLVEGDELDPFFFVRDEDAPVRALLKSYRGNGAWCKRRLADALRLPNPSEYFYPFLTPTSYERVLSGYESAATQESYEALVLRNVRLAFVLLGLEEPPRRFGECRERAGELEGRVLVRSVPAEAP